MQDFSIFDMVIIGITLALGLKGLFKGFIKEVFGLVGIIGGIYVASRFSDVVGDLIAPLLALESKATITLIGFVTALVGFWIVVYILGMILSKVFAMSGLGVFDRLLGFVFGSAKIFLIFAVIAHALYQIESFKTSIDEKATNSYVIPFLLKTGSYIVKLDTKSITSSVEKTVEVIMPSKKNVAESIEVAKETITETINETKEMIQEKSEALLKEKTEEKIKEMLPTSN